MNDNAACAERPLPERYVEMTVDVWARKGGDVDALERAFMQYAVSRRTDVLGLDGLADRLELMADQLRAQARSHEH